MAANLSMPTGGDGPPKLSGGHGQRGAPMSRDAHFLSFVASNRLVNHAVVLGPGAVRCLATVFIGQSG